MTFLNPSILFALFAISIPIIIHFFNLRKLKKVEFSTLMFLKELQKSKMKRIKLKQLLLLLFRILVITFLVLAFANPVYKGTAVNSSSSSASLIIVDNSFSMSGKDAYGEYLEQAKVAVNDIVSTLNPSDEITIIASSEFGKSSPVYWTNTQSNYKDSVKNISISYKDFNLPQCIEYAKDIISKSSALNKNVYILSDFQKNNFIDVNSSNPTADYSVFAVNIGKREVNNISLEDFKIESAIIEQGRDIKLSVNVHNFSQYALSNKTINVYSRGNDSSFVLKGEKVVDLQSSENKKVELTFKAEKSGNNSGMIELVIDNAQDDEIKYDNKIYFSFFIPEKFKIGLIGNDTKFMKLAIETASIMLADSAKNKSSLLELNELSTVPSKLSDYNIVFVSGIDRFGNTDIESLSNYAVNGGTAYFFPSQSADISSYNDLFTKLNSAHLTNINSDGEVNKSIKVGRVNFEHPLLSGIFKNEKLNFTSDKFILDSPELKSFYSITPGEEDVTLIELSNNKPFLVENNIGQGRVLLSAVSANDKMSDLPMKSIFVPLIVRSIFYSQGNVNQTSYTIGKNNVISLNRSFRAGSAINPLKNKITYSSSISSSYIALPYSGFSSVPGIYSFTDSLNAKYSFAINFNSGESNLAKEGVKEIEENFKNSFKNVKIINDISQVKDSIKEAKYGIELWKYFLILALIFIAAELVLSRKIMRE
ncbi:MAG: BatA and WFA domain-containing protein [Ignavibacteria bacterium]|nr:BatA and WFA domain-containing protein [Ignavibacteria bacterium]